MEERIALFQEKLKISREEAIALIADDDADVSVELTAEQAKVAKEMAQADRKKETTPRKRERKSDDDKRYLIAALADCLLEAPSDEMEDVSIINPEREIQFEFRGALYKLTLSKPRKS